MLTKVAESKILKRRISGALASVNQEDWNLVLDGRNIYLSIPYLKALEKGMEGHMKFFFSISYNERKEPVLIAVFVRVKFVDKRRKFADSIFKMRFPFKKRFEDIFTINALTCGNVFSAGENGMIWSEEIEPSLAFEEINTVVEALTIEQDLKNQVSLNVFKDFWSQTVPYSNALKDKGYFDFKIDVNMVLTINEAWHTMEDYLGSMKTKFRTRAHSVYKKSNPLVLKSLNAADIIEQGERIGVLFEKVLEKSAYHIGTITPETFAACKENLGGDFEFKAYFLDGLMVGFSTSFMNTHSLDANYVGLDYAYNEQYDIYQRILYDYVEQALKTGVKELQLGRTSELIKSAIGAVPKDMMLYIKHKRKLSNLVLKNVIKSVAPSAYDLRKPFKANFIN